MKIYIATSWKMEGIAKELAKILRENSHEVDCFCDASTGRYVFHWSEFVEKEEDLSNYNAIDFLKDPKTQKAFQEDKVHIDWCEAVVMILPCGRSAHMEAGYAKGCGKMLFIYGEFPQGEFDVMYGFADGMFSWSELSQLICALKGGVEPIRIGHETAA